MIAVCFVFLGYYFVELLDFWIILLGAIFLKPPKLPPDLTNAENFPFLVVVAPCRDGAASIPGMVECFKNQTYPKNRFRFVLLADNCSDNSAELARSLGADVYERRNDLLKTKGAALNEWFDKKMRHESFDAITILDIDSRVKPDFLARVAARLENGASVMQAIYISTNSEDNSLTRIGDRIQTLVRTVQRGRAALGLPAALTGSGLTIRRSVLEKLGWWLGGARSLGEDMEFNIRCMLNDIKIEFAPEQPVSLDVAENANDLRSQRRRWSMAGLELAGEYGWPLMKKVLSGDWRTLEMLFSSFLALPFSVLFVAMSAGLIPIGVAAVKVPYLMPMFLVILALWLMHALYYVVALKTENAMLSLRDFWGLAVYMGVRFVTILETPFLILFMKGDRWKPMPPQKDKNKR